MPGSSGRLEFRSEDPNGPYSRPMLGLREGRYPTGADEVGRLADSLATAWSWNRLETKPTLTLPSGVRSGMERPSAHCG